jgi:serine protease Do
VVVDVVDELLDDGRVEHAFLGTALRALTPELVEQYGIDTDVGVLVVAVVPGGPADEAGIRPSDVITAIGDDEVAEPGDLAAALRDHEPGGEVEIELWRDGGVEAVTVVLGALPPSGG